MPCLINLLKSWSIQFAELKTVVEDFEPVVQLSWKLGLRSQSMVNFHGDFHELSIEHYCSMAFSRTELLTL